MFTNSPITPMVIAMDATITMRKISIILDCRYMACNRVIVMTSMACHSDDITEVVQLGDSPPSIVFTDIVIQLSAKYTVLPEKYS